MDSGEGNKRSEEIKMRHEFKKKSRILLIDDNYEHLAGIRELLNLEGTFDVVGAATNVRAISSFSQ